MKKTKIKKDLFNRIKEIGSENKVRGITLISLVITIIILLILAGITISQLTGSGIFEKVTVAKNKTEYASAKEIINSKLMEIQTTCIQENKEYTIQEIAKEMKKSEETTIELIHYYELAFVSSEVESTLNNINKVKGIVVSVKQYPEYKFLIGETCTIEGVEVGKIPENMDEFTDTAEFEENIVGVATGNGEAVDPNAQMDLDSDLRELLKQANIQITVDDIINIPSIINYNALIPTITSNDVTKTSTSPITYTVNNNRGIIRTASDQEAAWHAFNGDISNASYSDDYQEVRILFRI